MGIFSKAPQKESEPETILQSDSPVCQAQAFVEKSDSSYYFYIWLNYISNNPTMKVCWICNRKKAPQKLNVNSMGNGRAPMMPAQYVAHNPSGMELDESQLEIVWFEEGESAALLYCGELICVIPGWSGYKDFHGYSRFASGTGPYAWELKGALKTLTERVQKSRSFWKYFDGNFWPQVQHEHLEALESFFGKHEKYYAIDGEKFPPKAYVCGSRNDISYGITAGVSMIPMPKIEQVFGDNSHSFRRIELGIAAVQQHSQLCQYMGGVISSLSAMPWKEITFLAHGHTVPFNNIKGFSALLFVNPKYIPGMEHPSYSGFMGEDINLLWIVPITQEEYDFVVKNSSAELIQKAANCTQLHIFNGEKKFYI